ncbi:hypothetical protein [Desulfospira joergensenii]|uniref:hypothetical protein n=1 Tax=Desulfospira joergensenii TaxID=53329 RepID=UPI0004125B8E|nr:hypothetical protein [Desulfospira joergensenii]
MTANDKKRTKWGEWLFETWGMTYLKIKLPFAEADFIPMDADRDAAWELYIEMLTRIATQDLERHDGDERTALTSIYSLFDTTRDIIRRHGRKCGEFSKIAIIVLNHIVRPFTSKWHRASLAGAFEDPGQQKIFRQELELIQSRLKTYTKMLADMAGVEDLTDIEEEKDLRE